MRTLRASISLFVIVMIEAAAAQFALAQAQPPALPPLTRGVTHETWTSDIAGLTKETSTCLVSDNPTYGLTPDDPVKVGGDAMYVAARSKQFLNALRGPSGEGLHYKRLGSFDHTDGALLDVYLVEHRRGATHIYMDGYRFEQPKAPIGFLCAASPPDPPRPSGVETQKQRLTLAARFGALMPPISLDADGSALHGVVFDHVRLVGRAVAGAEAAGQRLDAANLPATIVRAHVAVVAYPLQCAGRGAIAPESVRITDAHDRSPRVVTEELPHVRSVVSQLPHGSSALAVVYDADLAVPGRVEITYAEACAGASRTISLPLRGEAGRITQRVPGRAPSGHQLPGGPRVHVQVLFDPDGMPHFPTYAGGPAMLADAAVEAVTNFRAEPPRVNGAPLLQASTVAVAFEP